MFVQGDIFDWSPLNFLSSKSLYNLWQLEKFWASLHGIWDLVKFLGDQSKKSPCSKNQSRSSLEYTKCRLSAVNVPIAVNALSAMNVMIAVKAKNAFSSVNAVVIGIYSECSDYSDAVNK